MTDNIQEQTENENEQQSTDALETATDFCDEADGFQKRIAFAKKRTILTRLFCFLIIGAGIALGVMVRVSVGLAMTVAGYVLYITLCKNIAYKYFAIEYKSNTGELYITAAHGRHNTSFRIPERIVGLQVAGIEEGAFMYKSSAKIEQLYLPSSIRYIKKGAFAGCDALTTIHFLGTAEEWERIDREEDMSAYVLLFECDWAYAGVPASQKRDESKGSTTQDEDL